MEMFINGIVFVIAIIFAILSRFLYTFANDDRDGGILVLAVALDVLSMAIIVAILNKIC